MKGRTAKQMHQMLLYRAQAGLLRGLINPHTNVGHFSFKINHVEKWNVVWRDQQAKGHMEREDDHPNLSLERKRISREMRALRNPPPTSLPSVAHWGLQKALEV